MNVHFSIYGKLEMKTFEGKLFKMHSMLMTFDLIEVRDSETSECFVRFNLDFRRWVNGDGAISFETFYQYFVN